MRRHSVEFTAEIICLLKYTLFVVKFVCDIHFLRKIHSLYRSESPPQQCDLVHSLSNSNVFSFPSGSLAAAYNFFLVFSSLLSSFLLFPSITHFRRQTLRKMWPIPVIFLPSILRRFFFLLWIYIPLYFSQGRSNWSSPSFSSTAFQNFPGVSDLHS
jgi:hypothetical protein